MTTITDAQARAAAATVTMTRAEARTPLGKRAALAYHEGWSKADRAMAHEVLDLIEPDSYYIPPSKVYVAAVKDGKVVAYIYNGGIDLFGQAQGKVPWAWTPDNTGLPQTVFTTRFRQGRSAWHLSR